MTTLVLIGPHAAGKSTLGRAIARRLGWPFHHELGEELLVAPPPGLATGPHALARPAAFDRRVIADELARDAAWSGPFRVVETWHPGNLAYAMHRNPTVAHDVGHIIAGALSRRDVVVQPVTASPRTLAARCREPGPPTVRERFFLAVAETAVALARSWGLTVLEPIATDRVAVPNAVDRVISALVQTGRRAVA